jgi:outer membrane lipoprotein SlyB
VQTDAGVLRTYEVPAPGDLRIGDRVRVENGVIARF